MWDNAYCVHDLTDTPDTLLNLYELCCENGTEDQVMIFALHVEDFLPGAPALRRSRRATTTSRISRCIPSRRRSVRISSTSCATCFSCTTSTACTALMKGHRAILEPKFRLCELMLEESVGDLGIAEWNKPNGGYFISVDVLDGCAQARGSALQGGGRRADGRRRDVIRTARTRTTATSASRRPSRRSRSSSRRWKSSARPSSWRPRKSCWRKPDPNIK